MEDNSLIQLLTEFDINPANQNEKGTLKRLQGTLKRPLGVCMVSMAQSINSIPVLYQRYPGDEIGAMRTTLEEGIQNE